MDWLGKLAAQLHDLGPLGVIALLALTIAALGWKAFAIVETLIKERKRP